MNCGLYSGAAFSKAIRVAKKHRIVSAATTGELEALRVVITAMEKEVEEMALDTADWPEEFFGASPRRRDALPLPRCCAFSRALFCSRPHSHSHSHARVAPSSQTQ